MLPSVMDYRQRSRRRLPRLAFDYLEGGAEEGITMARNLAAYGDVEFRPEVLVNVTQCDLGTRVLGADLAMPAVVGPTGLNGLFWPDADLHLACAAHAAGLPFALSTASNTLLEKIREETPGELWLQLYVQQDRRIAEDLMSRAWANGFTVLLLTVDVPVHGNRDHDKRNGFKMPLRYTPRLIADLARHPHWCWQILRHGSPQLKNLAVSSRTPENIAEQAAALSRQMDLALTWDDVPWLRRHWPGKVVIKGVQTLSDARKAQGCGVDGIVLSNHGGRQLDTAPCALHSLSAIAEELGDSLDILIDGGIRRGSDIAKAVAMGAKAVLMGRAPLYGVAARGRQGVSDVLDILRAELETTLRLLGRPSIDSLDKDVVHIR